MKIYKIVATIILLASASAVFAENPAATCPTFAQLGVTEIPASSAANSADRDRFKYQGTSEKKIGGNTWYFVAAEYEKGTVNNQDIIKKVNANAAAIFATPLTPNAEGIDPPNIFCEATISIPNTDTKIRLFAYSPAESIRNKHKLVLMLG
jgi:hypothetical protein